MDEKKLISLVQMNPVIYNVFNEHYNDLNLRIKVWNEIGEQLGTTGESCRKVWINIRNRYLRYKRYKEKGWGPQFQIENWQYENEMIFYAKYLAQRQKNQKIPQLLQPSNQPDETPLLNDEPVITNTNQVNSVTENQSVTLKEHEQIATNANNSQIFVKELDENLENEDCMPCEEDDVLKTFFDAILETVSGFSDQTQHNAKAKIFSIVSELEERELNLKALIKSKKY